MLGVLPFVIAALMALVNPGYLLPLVTDPRGWALLGLGATMLTLGVGTMTMLIRFEP